jgi:putative tryptophan/tyrosine transport system substrate-binding protein
MGGFDESDHESQSWIAAFREELRKLGWMEGRNIEIDTRWAKADLESMERLAKELVALQPDLILTTSTPAAGVMLQHTRTIPIIFLLVADLSVAASSPASRDRAAMPPVLLLSLARWVANGWNS